MNLEESLMPGAVALVRAVQSRYPPAGEIERAGLSAWMLVLLERHRPMAESVAPALADKFGTLVREASSRAGRADADPPLAAATLIARAQEIASARGRDKTNERDLAAAILERVEASLADGSLHPGAAAAPTPLPTQAGMPPLKPADKGPRTKKPTPTLDQLGRDLTHEASLGKLAAIVSRGEETQLVIETLCRHTKRNPVLVGPAGVGKTAIAEGLARRIVDGQVPALLKGCRLVALQPSVLVAGASVYGQLEKRMAAVLDEAQQDGLILFIDEIHSIIGAGGREGTSDLASLLKPALARGELACMAATTDDEYRKYIEPDTELERRFQPIRIHEPTQAQMREILASVRDHLASRRGVRVDDRQLAWIVDFAERYLRNRRFPDKAIDLLDQAVAFAIAQNRDHLSIADLEAVAHRLIGMPFVSDDRLAVLGQRLTDLAFLPAEMVAKLIARLKITARGLDVRPSRPNAVLLLGGEAGSLAGAIAGVIAGGLFGAPDREVTIDFGRFQQSSDVTMLLGAPPGYVGYSESLPIHRLAQTPWCVLIARNVDRALPQRPRRSSSCFRSSPAAIWAVSRGTD